MRKTILFGLLLFTMATLKAQESIEKTTTYFLIRHAEKVRENPADKNLVFHIAFFDEATRMPYPINYSGAKSSYKLSSNNELENGFVSDLKSFDNASMIIEKNGNYYHVSYLGTYKDNYSILISIVSKDLSTKEKVDAFLREYLDAFKKEALK